MFDWGLSAGNGTFQSLCWAFQYLVNNPSDYWEPSSQTFTLNAGNYATGGFIDPTDGSIWYIPNGAAGIIYKYNPPAANYPQDYPTNGIAQISSLSPTAFDISGDSTSIWYVSSASPFNILRISRSSPTILQTIAKPWAAAVAGWIAFDGTSLYVAAQGQTAPNTIYKILAVDGTAQANWTHPEVISGMGWDQDTGTLRVVSTAPGMNASGYGPTYTSTTGNPKRDGVFGYTPAGTLRFGRTLLAGNGQMNAPFMDYGMAVAGNQPYSLIGSWQNILLVAGVQSFGRFRPNLGARTLLTAPVTKTSAQTMRITYQFNIT